MGEFEFRADTPNNRLYMKLSGFFKESESEEVFQSFLAAVNQLRPGFDIINDIRGFIPASPGAAKTISRAAEVIKKKKVGRMIRVTGKVVTGLLQFKRLLFGMSEVEYANSIEEAEKLLDS